MVNDPKGGTSSPKPEFLESLDYVRVRFAGDSGDGMQVTGTQFATSAALSGNDVATFPDYPAEIRAPAGTVYGVSSYSVNFGSAEILTSGDQPDVLVAMNPAALRVHLPDLRRSGMVIVDTGAFAGKNLARAGFEANPIEDGTLSHYAPLPLDISGMTLKAVKPLGLGQKDSLRCKNMWALGLVLWMFGRKREPVLNWLQQRFQGRPELAEANTVALNAGHAFGETAELGSGLRRYSIAKATIEPGTYRTATGTEALTWGLFAGTKLAGLKLVLGSYPITPASPMLHMLSAMKAHGVVTFQAEDEIAAICSAIGASYAGALGVTTSSGPGIALKTEAIGLAVSTELPLIIVNVQRGGPSTGLPTKTEQADLYQALFGRNGDAPIPILAARSPSDCFDCGIEAVRIATKYMTPVMVLTDGYIANAAEAWHLPDVATLEPMPVTFRTDPEGFSPYVRNETTGARAWAVPGTPGLEHRIGGLEKDYETGNVSYDRDNHQRMTDIRVGRVFGIAQDIPEQTVESGDPTGDLAIVGWGSTYGAIEVAVHRARDRGLRVSHIHLRHLWPLPANLGALLKGFGRIIVPEMNTGQLVTLLRAQYLLPAEALSKVTGQPFKIAEITTAIEDALGA